ncbi:MAG: trigger factor [Patescibacteria group bacterium]|nr:hypothetical protein [Patescibacteria group bacterium]
MDLKITLDRKQDSSFEINITVPAEKVIQAEKEILKKESGNVEVDGFRKGKVPLEIAEKKLDPRRIYQGLIQKLASEAYLEAVKEYNLNPVVPPKVIVVSAEKGKDWKIKITSCEIPEIDLAGLEEEIKKINAKSKIWTPGKESQKPEKEGDEQREESIQKIITLIVKTVKVNLPEILLEHELNGKLTDLVDQIQKVGLTVDQYLTSKNMTIEQLRQQYRLQIEAGWKIDLSLEKVADKNKIVVSPEETEKYQKTKINPYLAARIIRRDKALEYLISL